MLGEQYVRYDSDDILCLSPLDLPLQVLPLFLVTPSFFPLPSLYIHSILLNILPVSSWLGDSLRNMIIKKPFCLAVKPFCLAVIVHICKSESTYQNFIYLPTYLPIHCFSFSYPNVYSLISFVLVEIQIARI